MAVAVNHLGEAMPGSGGRTGNIRPVERKLHMTTCGHLDQIRDVTPQADGCVLHSRSES